MKKLLIVLALLFAPLNAHAATYYFSTSGSNSNSGTQLSPYLNSSARSAVPGEIWLLKAGDEWNLTEWALDDTCTAEARCTLGRYGTGANPKIAGNAVTTPTWVSAGGGIYYTTGQTQGTIKSVTVDGNDTTAGYSLNRVGTVTGILNNALPAGTYCRSASTTAGSSCNNVSGTGSNLFVRLSDDSDPTGHSIRIASYTHNSGNGDRGLLRTTSTGDYWDIVDIDVIHSNGIHFSASGYATRTAYLRIFGGGRDGYLRYCNNTGAEDGSYGGDFGSEVSWNSMLGRGNGQGITDYCNNNFYIDTLTHHNAMAGFDTLDLGTTTTVSYILVKRMKAYYNGLDYDSGSFDGNIYNDGGNNIAVMDSQSWGTGVGSGGGANARWGFLSGSERPTTDPADDVYWMNNLSNGNNGLAAELNNPTTSTAEMGEHYIWGNTFSAQIAGGSTDRVLGFSDLPTVDSLVSMRENIFIGNSSAAIWNPTTTITDTMMDSDLNIAYRRGGSTNVFRRNSVDMNLATWQSTTGEDASTVIGDPLFTTDSDTAMVATLQDGSPALDACGNTARELEADIVSHFSAMFPTTASKRTGRGSTRANGTLDDPSTSKDCGFHYNYGYVYPANVAPQSLTASVTGSVDVSFTLSDSALPYNGKIKVTLPAGMSWDSGGTTAISNVVGMTGTYTLSVSSQVLTITRVGDGYSTMPQAISFTLSNVQNPTAGTSGSYTIETFKSDGTTKIATSAAEYGMAIEGDTFISPGPVAHVTFGGQTLTCQAVCTFS